MIPPSSLETLIGGYLHQDWCDDYVDAWSAVDTFVRQEPTASPGVRSDVDQVLAAVSTEHELEQIMDRFGLGYDPIDDGFPTYRVWLRAVADRVEGLLASQAHTQPPLKHSA